jgi:signal transduction histidine kinase
LKRAPRRPAVLATRYFAQGPLERDRAFCQTLTHLAHRGLIVAGAVALCGIAAYLAFHLLAGDPFVWAETYATRKSHVAMWDKVLVGALALAMVAIGRLRPGLPVARATMAAFVLASGWVIVLENFNPDNYNISSGWLTLLLVVSVGTVPYRTWQIVLLGAGLTVEYWYFAAITPGAAGDRAGFYFLVLAIGVNSVVAGALYASRYAQHRSLRRMARLKRSASARNDALAAALKRERAMQEQLVVSEKLASLGRLTAGVAHELKNPLNFVTNFAGLARELVTELRQELERDPERRAADFLSSEEGLLEGLEINTEKIAKHGQRADAIIRNMLAHSRATPGERRPTDLNRLLDEYVGLAYHGMRAAHSGFNVDIRRDLDPALGTPEVVPEELGRVFLNLLDNAFDAVRARATDGSEEYAPAVSVATRRRDDGGVEIRISDNGAGMTDEVAAHIFEPFYTTKDTGEGTGLGLSLAYDVVTQAHGGTIEVDSRPGEGTTFLVTIPPDPAAAVDEDLLSRGVDRR